MAIHFDAENGRVLLEGVGVGVRIPGEDDLFIVRGARTLDEVEAIRRVLLNNSGITVERVADEGGQELAVDGAVEAPIVSFVGEVVGRMDPSVGASGEVPDLMLIQPPVNPHESTTVVDATAQVDSPYEL